MIITAIDQGNIRIGIRGPRHVPVYREELYQKIQEENHQAAKMKVEELDQIIKAYTQERCFAVF